MKRKRLYEMEQDEILCLTQNGGKCHAKQHPYDRNFYCPYRRSNGKGNHLDLDQIINRIKRIDAYKKTYTTRPAGSRYEPRKFINAFKMYDTLTQDQKKLIMDNPSSFKKEHEKYESFLLIYKKSFLNTFSRIIVIGVGAIFEWNEYMNPCKNEIVTFVERGFGDKLLLFGLKGNNNICKNSEETKELKYKMWLNLVNKNQIIRTWVTGDISNKIPYSDERTLILVTVDGETETSSPQFLKTLMSKRPNSIIDFFCLRAMTKRRLENGLGIKVKPIHEWTQPSPPLFYYRVKSTGLNSVYY